MKYKTSLGLQENVVGALTYILFWLTGFIFLLIEKENRFVRFHAIQSMLTFIPLALIVFLVAWIPYYGWMIADFLGFISLFLLLICVILAYRGLKFKLPVVGNIAYNAVYNDDE